jgi:hypothetical protein
MRIVAAKNFITKNTETTKTTKKESGGLAASHTVLCVLRVLCGLCDKNPMSGRRARSAPERAKVVYRGSYDIFIVGCRRDERTDASAFIFVQLRFQIPRA